MVKRVLLAAALLISAALRCDDIFHHTWSIHVHTDAEPHRIASQLDMVNLGPIGTIPNHYLFRHNKHPRFSSAHSQNLTDNIIFHDNIIHATQQKLLSRKKRKTFTSEFDFNDEYFKKQWYLYDDYNNVTGAWRQGVTGRGIVVTILDDGLEHTHPDIEANYEARASIDLNDNDDDPMPRYDITNENKHGTRCAGEVASVADNAKCGVGAAYFSRIGGVRMLDGDVTDAIEARALGLRPEFIDIYSSSWGPDDDGRTVDGPGSLTVKSFTTGINEGRDGRGSIFVWASGNGGVSYDNCNCDGYTNSIWTLSIGSASELGQKPWYAEECSSTLAVTFSSGGSKEKQILSTDLHSKCTERHTGTSAAAPLAAGIFALVLQANPLLTWRDLQHLVVRTSKERNLQDPVWAVNGAGFKVSHKFGYGVLDAGGLVELAQLWNNVPTKSVCESTVAEPDRNIGHGQEETFRITSDGCDGDVVFVEHVQCAITMSGDKRGDMVIYITSPNGTQSTLLTPRKFDGSGKGFNGWPFLTVHHWGENPAGTWELKIRNNGMRSMRLESWQLILHGTATFPELRDTKRDIPSSGNTTGSTCDSQCEPSTGCVGTGPGNCTSCAHYLQQSTNICVEICGPGEHLDRKGTVCVAHCETGQYVTASGQCQSCDSSCETCDGPNSNNCTACNEGLFSYPSTHSCLESCPPNTILRNDECHTCHADCLTCTDVGYDKCLTCKDSLFFLDNRCYQSCPQGYYSDSATGSCVPCATGCTSCFGTASDQCVACEPDLYLGDSQCITNCSTSYYIVASSRVCRRCHYTCESCVGDTAYQCTHCIAGLFRHSDGQCTRHCSDGYTSNATSRTCEPCQDPCQTCFGTGAKQCSSCAGGMRLEDTQCVPSCPDGQYITSEDSECVACDSSCLECTGTADCVSCASGTILHNGLCIKNCPKGWHKTSGTCAPCNEDGSCVSCRGSGACTECQPGYILSEESCINPCSSGQYLKDGVCSVCSGNCEACFGPSRNQCSRCIDTSTNALMSKYSLTGQVYCDGCTDGCELCSQPFNNYCLSCNSGDHLLRDTTVDGRASCVESCPYGTAAVLINGLSQCSECDATCAHCDGATSRSCTTCPAGYVLEQKACLSQCSDSFYRDRDQCLPCDNACKTCIGPGSNDCMSCPPGYIHQEKSCVIQCSTGFFKRDDSCQVCHPTCTECSGNSQHQCSKCIDGFTLDEDRCTNTCEQGLYNDKTLNVCRACHVSCRNCTDEGIQSCLTCKAPLVKNPTTNACWPCCSVEKTQHCCYCSEDAMSVTCYDNVLVDGDDEIEFSKVKVGAGIVFGSIMVLGLLSMFGYFLYVWRRKQRPVTYTLLNSKEDHDNGLINNAFQGDDYQEEIMTMIHT